MEVLVFGITVTASARLSAIAYTESTALDAPQDLFNPSHLYDNPGEGGGDIRCHEPVSWCLCYREADKTASPSSRKVNGNSQERRAVNFVTMPSTSLRAFPIGKVELLIINSSRGQLAHRDRSSAQLVAGYEPCIIAPQARARYAVAKGLGREIGSRRDRTHVGQEHKSVVVLIICTIPLLPKPYSEGVLYSRKPR